MDGLSQDSPWTSLILVIDYFSRLLDRSPWLPLVTCITCGYYALVGGRLDIVLISALLVFLNKDVVLTSASRGEVVGAGLIIAFGGWATWVCRRPPQSTSGTKDLTINGPKSSDRPANGTERKLEAAFRRYLRHLVEKSPSSISVDYIPSGTFSTNETFTSAAKSSSAEHAAIKILTPAFYARFVHYAHDFEAIFSELTESRSLWVDKPDILPKIFLKKWSPPLHAPTITDFAYFKLMQKLRRRPKSIRSSTSSAALSSSTTRSSDIRVFRISSMDAFVLEQNDKKLKRAYRSAVMRLFMADWVAMGNLQLISLAELLWRFMMAWPAAMSLNQLVRTAVQQN